MRKIFSVFVLFLAAAVPQVVDASPYGIGGYLSTRMNSSEMTTAADRLDELHASWVRQEFLYDNIGGASGSNFGADDEAADKLRAKGLKILGMLNFANTPPSSGDWESFVGNTVAHFADKVDAWEVMNEPNDAAQPSRQMNPPTYNDYLAKSHAKIKQFDSSATVVTGATAGVDISWLGELISVGGCSHFDAIGIHPYRDTRPEQVKFGEGDFAGYVSTAVALVRRNCSSKKVWLTEFGLQSGVVGDTAQANYLARQFLLARIFPEVEAIISYHLRNEGSETWGVTTNSFDKKTSFGRVQDVFGNVGDKSFSDELVVLDRKLIHAFDNTDGWGQQFNNNASASLSQTGGVSGNGMKIAYQFNGSSSAVILTKQIAIDGDPTGIGLFVNGDNSRAIWRLRFTDANNETFQALLGNAMSGWGYRWIDLANTGAMTSWEGDGKIQYPIKFNSIVLDRDGGSSSGTVSVDSLTGIYGPADLKALRFGSMAVAWKAQGSATASVCGQSVGVSEQPVYLSVSTGCGSNGITGETASSGGSSTPAPTTSPTSSQKKTTTPAPTTSAGQTFDATKSIFSVSKPSALANGQDTVELKIVAKDTTGADMTVPSWAVIGLRAGVRYTPPVDSTTSAQVTAEQVGIDTLTAMVGDATLPQTVRIVWVNPTDANLPAFDRLSPDQILTIDTSDPLTKAGEQVIQKTVEDILGFKITLPGLDPSQVLATLNSTPVSIALTKADDGTFTGVMQLPDEVGDHQLTILAYDANGTEINKTEMKVVLQPVSIATQIGIPVATGIPLFIWIGIGVFVLLIIIGILRKKRLRLHS